MDRQELRDKLYQAEDGVRDQCDQLKSAYLMNEGKYVLEVHKLTQLRQKAIKIFQILKRGEFG